MYGHFEQNPKKTLKMSYLLMLHGLLNMAIHSKVTLAAREATSVYDFLNNAF